MAIWLWRLACPGEEDWTLPAVDGKGSYVETKWLAIEQGDVTSLHIFGTYFSCFEPTVGHLLKTRTAVQSHGQPWHQWCDRCLTWISVRYYEHHFFLRNRMFDGKEICFILSPSSVPRPRCHQAFAFGNCYVGLRKGRPAVKHVVPRHQPDPNWDANSGGIFALGLTSLWAISRRNLACEKKWIVCLSPRGLEFICMHASPAISL